MMSRSRATRKIAMYTLKMMIQNLKVLGLKFSSASAYSLSLSWPEDCRVVWPASGDDGCVFDDDIVAE